MDTPVLLPLSARFTSPRSWRNTRISVAAIPCSSTPVMYSAGVSASSRPLTRLPRFTEAMVLDST